MSGIIKIQQFADEDDIATPSSGYTNLATIADELLSKESNGALYRYLGYQKYTIQTTDATPTDVPNAVIPLSEGQGATVRAKVIARIADVSAALDAEIWVGARRASGGNVTLLGSVLGTVQEDSGSAPTVTLAADTSNQWVEVQVTGVAAETWNWEILLYGRVY